MRAATRLYLACLICMPMQFALADGTLEAEFREANEAYQGFAKSPIPSQQRAALPYAAKMYELGRKLYGESSRSTAALAYNYGRSLLQNNRFEEAEPILKKSLDLFEQNYGDDALELIDPLMSLGLSHYRVYNSHPQFVYYWRALAIAARHRGSNSTLYADLSLEAGSNILMYALTDEGRQYVERAYDIYTKTLPPGDPRIGKANFWLGKYDMAQGRTRSAEADFLAALDSFSKPGQPDTQMALTTHGFLVEVYEKLGEHDKATEQCLVIGRMTPADPNQEFLPIYQRPPIYPDSDRRAGKGGYVILQLTVGEDGSVRSPVVAESDASPSLQAAALEAARGNRYAPRFVDGKPVETPGVRFKYTFVIKGD